MNALVMATALVSGVAVGDNGEMAGADVGKVCADFAGEWEGSWVSERYFHHHICLRDGSLFLGSGLKGRLLRVCSYSLEAESESHLRLVLRDLAFHCNYTVEGQRIRICFTRSHAKGLTPFQNHIDEDMQWWALQRPQLKK